MTCIVGMVSGGEVILGGDSAGIAGYSVSVRSDEKVFTLNRDDGVKLALGFMGSFRMGQLLRYKLSLPYQRGGQDDYAWLVCDFIDSVRDTFRRGGWLEKQADQECGGTFLVGFKGNLYCVQGDFQVARCIEPYDAIGSGFDLALGALYATEQAKEKLPPQERLTIALQAASAFNAAVRPPYIFASTKA